MNIVTSKLSFTKLRGTTLTFDKLSSIHIARNLSSPANFHNVNRFTERTHTCGQLSRSHLGERVNLFGWIQYTRFNNKIIALKDSYGVAQCILNQDIKESFKKRTIPNESVINISGIVRERPSNQKNDKIPTGEVEVVADSLQILSSAKKDLPILTRDDSSISLDNRLKNRYLDLRSTSMQQTLRFRSKICEILRNKLHNLDFIECETPTLFTRTPGGANEFIVPTKLQDKFYSLVQSPQQLKQLLMVGGLDRYFQICRCYRDESGRSDRQPEFTQVDIELSFTNQSQIMKLVEELLYDLFTEIPCDTQMTSSLIESFDQNRALVKMKYSYAFEKYGTDKPDTRFDWLIEPDSTGGLYIEISHSLNKGDVTAMIDAIKSRKLYPGNDDLRILTTSNVIKISTNDKSDHDRKILGALRLDIANELSSRGVEVYRRKFDFLWVTDFPLFTLDEYGKMEPNHHPFTAPTQGSLEKLTGNPMEVIGQHYDLVLNGQEVAGGSIRIHEPELQRRIFSDILQIEDDTFRYFIEALRSGCPPHGGIAIGLDRLVAMILGRKSISEVIAFPKTSSGRDLMTNCPHEIGSDVKLMYHIK